MIHSLFVKKKILILKPYVIGSIISTAARAKVDLFIRKTLLFSFMKNINLIWLVLAITGLAVHCTLPAVSFGQGESPGVLKTTTKETASIVTVSAIVTVPVSNDTIKTKDGMLRTSVIGFLNSGPNALKTSANDQPVVKSKIVNLVNNDTQNVEGPEATNAIVGVEISKALKSIVSEGNASENMMVTIQSSSSCKPTAVGSISCENTVTMKQ